MHRDAKQNTEQPAPRWWSSMRPWRSDRVTVGFNFLQHFRRLKFPSLKTIMAAAIVLFVVHAVEEFVTGFPDADRSFLWIAELFEGLTLPQSVFILYEICLITLLIAVFAVAFFRVPLKVFFVLLGIVMLLESVHIIAALVMKGYYPGLITALFFPVLSVLYWIRLLRDLRAERAAPSLQKG
jgi:hypothetical protein